MEKKLNILIFGTGAIATLLAIRLKNKNHIVVAGTWQERIEAFKNITLEEMDGSESNYKIEAYDRAEIPSNCQFDLIILAIKSYQTESTIPYLLKHCKKDATILSLQNGIEHIEKLSALDFKNLVFGTTTQGATNISANKVRHTGLGSFDFSQNELIEKSFSEIFTEVKSHVDVLPILWTKLAVNAGINPITALIEIPNGWILSNPFLKNLSKQLSEEVATVASALKINLLHEPIWEHTWKVAERTAQNQSSMLQDIENKRKTEIDSICLAVVNKGKELEIRTPWNNKMFELIKAKERGDNNKIEKWMQNPTI